MAGDFSGPLGEDFRREVFLRPTHTLHLPRAPVKEIWFFTSELEGERAGSFRQQRWCEVFLALGARVSIYNVPNGGAFRLTEAQFDSAGAFAEFRRMAVGRSKPMASIREGWKVRVLRRIKHLFLVDLYYPNIFRLIWRARRRLARSSSRVIVMSSSPPFSLALAGACLKALYPKQVVLAIDMRDPWTLHRSLGGIKPLKRRIETTVLRRADYLSTVSRGLNEQFHATHGVSMAVLYNVATHYAERGIAPEVNWSALNPAIAADKIKVVYTGSTPEGYYDLRSLVEGVKQFHQRAPALAARFQLVFVGACEEMQRESLAQGITNEQIAFIPHVSHQLARSIQQSADILLFLTYLGPGAVSTKIFEYMALQKPIFPVSVPKAADADFLLKHYCGVSCNFHTGDEISAALIRVAELGGKELPRLTDPQALHQLVEQYRAYATTLLSAVEGAC